jgi:hypothetical protein
MSSLELTDFSFWDDCYSLGRRVRTRTLTQHTTRPLNPRFKDAHTGMKRCLNAWTINRGFRGLYTTPSVRLCFGYKFRQMFEPRNGSKSWRIRPSPWSEDSSKFRGELPTTLHQTKLLEGWTKEKIDAHFRGSFQGCLGTSFGIRTIEKHLENVHLSFVQPSKIFVWGAYNLQTRCKRGNSSRRQLTPNFGRIFGPRAWATLSSFGCNLVIVPKTSQLFRPRNV